MPERRNLSLMSQVFAIPGLWFVGIGILAEIICASWLGFLVWTGRSGPLLTLTLALQITIVAILAIVCANAVIQTWEQEQHRAEDVNRRLLLEKRNLTVNLAIALDALIDRITATFALSLGEQQELAFSRARILKSLTGSEPSILSNPSSEIPEKMQVYKTLIDKSGSVARPAVPSQGGPTTLLDALFGCFHKNLSFPITKRPGQRHSAASSVTGSYVVCLNCGKEFPYDWREMKVISRKSESSGRAHPAPLPERSHDN